MPDEIKKLAMAFADGHNLLDDGFVVKGYRAEMAGGLKVILDEDALASASQSSAYFAGSDAARPYLHAYEEGRLTVLRPDNGSTPGLFVLGGPPKNFDQTKTGRFRIPSAHATNHEISGSDPSLLHPRQRQGFAIGPEGKYWFDPCLAEGGSIFSGPRTALAAGSWRYTIEAETRLMTPPTGAFEKSSGARVVFYELVANNGALRLDFGSFTWRDIYQMRGDTSAYPEIYATGLVRVPADLPTVEARLWLAEFLSLPNRAEPVRMFSGCVVKRVGFSR